MNQKPINLKQKLLHPYDSLDDSHKAIQDYLNLHVAPWLCYWIFLSIVLCIAIFIICGLIKALFAVLLLFIGLGVIYFFTYIYSKRFDGYELRKITSEKSEDLDPENSTCTIIKDNKSFECEILYSKYLLADTIIYLNKKPIAVSTKYIAHTYGNFII
jgi:hypothetical protein